ncbi:MAG: hypothetical protein KY453_00720 [Gemmatimonadetes bacterium]|nr:hypothetical protein [Gemmatimonadota bacterium]
MRRPIASLLLAAALAVQADVVPCPMTGGHAGDHAPASEAPVSQRPGGHGGHGGHPGFPAGSDGSSAPAEGTAIPSPVPVPTGGCGAMMGCGLAAVAPAARTMRDAPPLTTLRGLAPTALASSPPLSTEPPPPRA